MVVSEGTLGAVEDPSLTCHVGMVGVVLEGMHVVGADPLEGRGNRIRYAHVEGTGIHKGTHPRRCRMVPRTIPSESTGIEYRIQHWKKQQPVVCWIAHTQPQPWEGRMEVILRSGWSWEPMVLVGQLSWKEVRQAHPGAKVTVPMERQRTDGTQQPLAGCHLRVQLVVTDRPLTSSHPTQGRQGDPIPDGEVGEGEEVYHDAREADLPLKGGPQASVEGVLLGLLNWLLDLFLQGWTLLSAGLSWESLSSRGSARPANQHNDGDQGINRGTHDDRGRSTRGEPSSVPRSKDPTMDAETENSANKQDWQVNRGGGLWKLNLPQAAHQEVSTALWKSQKALGECEGWEGQFRIKDTVVSYSKGLTANGGSGHSLLYGRGTLEIADCTPDELAGVIMRANCRLMLKAFMDAHKSKGLLHTFNDHCQFCHLHIKPPWPVEQRSIFFLLARMNQPDGSVLVVGRGLGPQDLGLEVDTGGAVQAELVHGCYRVERGAGGSRVSLVLQVNAKMSLPHFAQVLLLRDLMGCLKRLKAELGKSRMHE